MEGGSCVPCGVAIKGGKITPPRLHLFFFLIENILGHSFEVKRKKARKKVKSELSLAVNDLNISAILVKVFGILITN